MRTQPGGGKGAPLKPTEPQSRGRQGFDSYARPSMGRTAALAAAAIAVTSLAACSQPNAAMPAVSQTHLSGELGEVTVTSPRYTVHVTASKQTWIRAVNGSGRVEFAGLRQPGDPLVVTPVNGKLVLTLGSSHATVELRLASQARRRWQFTPTSAPFTLDFAA